MKKIVLTSMAALSFVGAANSADLKVYASKDFDLTSGAFMAANLLQNIGFGVKYGQIRGEVLRTDLFDNAERLKEAGLEMPVIMDMLFRLKQHGVDIVVKRWSIDAVVEALLPRLGPPVPGTPASGTPAVKLAVKPR